MRAIPLSDTSIHLLWSPLRYDTPYPAPEKDTPSFPKGYAIEYKEGEGAWRPVYLEGNNSNKSVFTNLKPDTEYSFRARFDLTPIKSSGDYYGPWKTTSARTLLSGESRDPELTDTDLRSPISMCNNIGRTAVWVLSGRGDDGLWEGSGYRVGVYWEPSVWATEYEVEYKNLKTNQSHTRTYKNFVMTTYGLPDEPVSIRIRNKNATRTSWWSEPTVVALAPLPKTNEIQHIQDGDLIRVNNDNYLNRNDIYIVKRMGNKNFKRLILNPEIFNSYQHLQWDNVKRVSYDTLDYFITSDLVMEVHPDGTPVNGRIYRLFGHRVVGNKLEYDGDTGTKRHIQLTPQQFEQAGGDWDSVYHINYLEASDTFYRPALPIRTVEHFVSCSYRDVWRNCPLHN